MDFDEQAERFEARTGLPRDAMERAATILSGLATEASGVVLDVGAGTGLVGLALSERVAAYVALDASAAMLDVFRRALPAGSGARLIVANADERWPLDDRAVSVVFGSRSLHLLSPTHVAAESSRVLACGGHVVVGRVERDPRSARAALRRELGERLRARGLRPRSGGGGGGALASTLADHGLRVMEARVAGRWTERVAPLAALASWRSKRGLAGLDLEPEVQTAVLDELGAWAEATLPAADQPVDEENLYVLTPFRRD